MPRVISNNCFISTGPYLSKYRDEPQSANTDASQHQHVNEKRTDLEKLKELLLQKKTNDEKLVRKKPEREKTKAKTGLPVQVSRITDILSTLKQREHEQPAPTVLTQRGGDSTHDTPKGRASTTAENKTADSSEPSTGDMARTKSAHLVDADKFKLKDALSSLLGGHLPEENNKSQTAVEENNVEVTERSNSLVLKFKSTPSVDTKELRDALSALEQDSSAADEVVMEDHQISLSAIEGVYNIKQRQFQDKTKRNKLRQSSLKNGPRTHMFDDVQEKWSHEHDYVNNSIFVEMAEQEVKNLGMSAVVQSGFHDLMENVHRQWPFPIDNEICKEEEDVSFDEHVFLEHHLAEFPKAGNIQQFMELVVTGLQQNPHLSVQDKKEHIEWFKEYFENIPDEQAQL